MSLQYEPTANIIQANAITTILLNNAPMVNIAIPNSTNQNDANSINFNISIRPYNLIKSAP